MSPTLTIQSWQSYVNDKYYNEITTMRNIDNFIDKNSLSGGLDNVKIQDLWKKNLSRATQFL